MKHITDLTCLLAFVFLLTLPLGCLGGETESQKAVRVQKLSRMLDSEKKPKSQTESKWPPSDQDCNKEDVILAWNRIALDANVRDHNGFDKSGDKFTETMGPPASAVQLAKVHLAMFDAYNSITKEYNPAVVMLDYPDYTDGASINAAVATAAYNCLIMAYPLQAEYFVTAWEEWLDTVTDLTAKKNGMQVGSMVSSMMIVERMGDGTAPGSAQNYDFSGRHQVDPVHPNQGVISPQGGKLAPFFIEKAFVAPPPPDLDTSLYTEAYAQVKTLGGDGITTPTTRNVMESVIGWYWSYNGSPQLGTPPRLCNEIARTVACSMGNTVGENARLFAMINGGLSDAGLSSWATKFTHNYWRPIMGIRHGNEDNNPDTEQDDTWTYLGASRSNPRTTNETNFSPPFPAYTSGHATFCAVTFKTLANFYGTNDIKVEFRSQEFDGETKDDANLIRPCLVQKFETLSRMTAQCAASRVFNGVHWSFDGSEGAKMGEDIADHIFEKSITPINNPQPTRIITPKVEDEITAILNRTVSPKMESCSDKEKDSTLEIIEQYFSKYQEEKRNGSPLLI